MRVVLSEKDIEKDAKPKNLVKVCFRCTKSAKEELVPLLEYIGQNGNKGHTFGIVVDPNDSKYRREFGFDGDGASYIDLDSIEVTSSKDK